MPNPHGYPIWYELLTDDPDAAKRFYDAVIGWTVEERPAGDMDYRMIGTPDGGNVGGVARRTAGLTPAGMVPGWRIYIGVDDVDTTAAAIVAAGGSVTIQPFDLPDIGRMAYVADPQGIAFYVMRGGGDGVSTAFGRAGLGRCSWNELVTPDQTAANAFYATVFGWTYPDRMEMPGDLGDYDFVAVGDETIGATMTAPWAGPKPDWRFYFRAPDIDAAAAAVAAGGGVVLNGPMDVPGGDRIIIATDPEGLAFGVVGSGVAS